MKITGIVKKAFAFLIILCLVIGNTYVVPVEAAKTVKATSITLNKTKYTLKKGNSITLKATVKPNNATNQALSWSSSDKKVATVTQEGKVTAKKNGKATITVKVKNNTKLKATCKITVGTPVTKVTAKSSKSWLLVGNTCQIKATVSPSKATNKALAWYSSDKKVATVSSKGVVKAKSAGTVTITAKAKDGSGKKSSVTLKIKKYQNLYANILRKKSGGSFQLIYVDKNKIPELAYFEGYGAHLDQVSLYTIYNGKAKYLGDLGAYSTLVYSKKKNRIFAYTGMEENDKLEAKYTYMISKGKLKKAPSHKGYTKKSAYVGDAYANNEANIKLMLKGKLK